MTFPDALPPDRLRQLLCSVSDESLTATEWGELNGLLDGNPAALDEYLEAQLLESLLHREFFAVPDLAPADYWQHAWQTIRDFANDYITLSALIAGLTMTIILLSLALIVPNWERAAPNVAEVDPPRPAVVARVTATHEATWDAASDANFKNIELFSGERLVLNSGLAVVEYGTGARVVLEGPAMYHIEGANAGDLRLGKLVARADTPDSEGFAVQIPGARVVDRGTEFAVKVGESQAADVIVLEGLVAVEHKGADTSQPKSRTLTAGQSLRIDAQGRAAGSSHLTKQNFTRGWTPRRTDAYAEQVLQQKPVAYWRFEEFNLGTTPDASGNGLTGKVGGNVTLRAAPDGLGRAAQFGAGYIVVDDQPLLRFSDRLTIECWLRYEGMPKAWERIVEKNYKQGYVLCLGPAAAPEFQLTPGHAIFGLNGVFAESAVPVNDGNWHHIVATWDGEHMLVYVDGQPGTAVAFAGPIGVSADPLTLGANSNSGERSTESFSGALDEFAIYNRGLTAEEVRTHFEGKAKQEPSAKIDP